MESNKNYTAVNFISNKGITVRLNSKYKSMHNKFMIIDNQSIQTGSYNYSVAANKSNAENVIYIKNDENIASKYTIEFNRLWNESAPLVLKN
ncbi:phospholipase D-like domain-containing protein [Yersinia kristensenii]|uniref:phospholipase D-like domain-containing protein n=1 Tax=Yersinia kristensenii TaxID=28152 RepID=UPI001E4D9611|nr:phospholipase D-like domain-containing protein [Yersinia kristensenii]